MIGKPVSKKTAEAMKIALNQASAQQDDKLRAIKLWNDLRWKLKTLDGDYRDVQALIDRFVIQAQTELISSQVRDAVVKRLNEMSVRLTEFNVEDEGS